MTENTNEPPLRNVFRLPWFFVAAERMLAALWFWALFLTLGVFAGSLPGWGGGLSGGVRETAVILYLIGIPFLSAGIAFLPLLSREKRIRALVDCCARASLRAGRIADPLLSRELLASDREMVFELLTRRLSGEITMRSLIRAFTERAFRTAAGTGILVLLWFLPLPGAFTPAAKIRQCRTFLLGPEVHYRPLKLESLFPGNVSRPKGEKWILSAVFNREPKGTVVCVFPATGEEIPLDRIASGVRQKTMNPPASDQTYFIRAEGRDSALRTLSVSSHSAPELRSITLNSSARAEKISPDTTEFELPPEAELEFRFHSSEPLRAFEVTGTGGLAGRAFSGDKETYLFRLVFRESGSFSFRAVFSDGTESISPLFSVTLKTPGMPAISNILPSSGKNLTPPFSFSASLSADTGIASASAYFNNLSGIALKTIVAVPKDRETAEITFSFPSGPGSFLNRIAAVKIRLQAKTDRIPPVFSPTLFYPVVMKNSNELLNDPAIQELFRLWLTDPEQTPPPPDAMDNSENEDEKSASQQQPSESGKKDSGSPDKSKSSADAEQPSKSGENDSESPEKSKSAADSEKPSESGENDSGSPEESKSSADSEKPSESGKKDSESPDARENSKPEAKSKKKSSESPSEIQPAPEERNNPLQPEKSPKHKGSRKKETSLENSALPASKIRKHADAEREKSSSGTGPNPDGKSDSEKDSGKKNSGSASSDKSGDSKGQEAGENASGSGQDSNAEKSASSDKSGDSKGHEAGESASGSGQDSNAEKSEESNKTSSAAKASRSGDSSPAAAVSVESQLDAEKSVPGKQSGGMGGAPGPAAKSAPDLLRAAATETGSAKDTDAPAAAVTDIVLPPSDYQAEGAGRIPSKGKEEERKIIDDGKIEVPEATANPAPPARIAPDEFERILREYEKVKLLMTPEERSAAEEYQRRLRPLITK